MPRFLPPTWPHADSGGSAAICTAAAGGGLGHTRGWCSSSQPRRSGRTGDGCAGRPPARVQGSGLLMCHAWVGVLEQHLCVHIQVVCFCRYYFSTNCRFSFKLHNAKCIFHRPHEVAATKTAAATKFLVKGTQRRGSPRDAHLVLRARAREKKYPSFV